MSKETSIVSAILEHILFPGITVPLASLLVEPPSFKKEGAGVELDLVLSVPCASVAKAIASAVQAACADAGLTLAAVSIAHHIQPSPVMNNTVNIKGVKNIIAVASGKGGVGKSTTSVNLALALAAEGARVGILDADIYGPSQPHMLGLEGQRPEIVNGNQIIPLQAYSIQMISMGSMVTDDTPMVWRGPMASGALQQLLTQALWDNLDYLIIDMPPGTGDIPLTLSQKVPVVGSVVVTTPQDIALLDAVKGIEMFQKVNIPVLGVVENMAMHICSECGHHEAIFGENGGEKLAAQYGVSTLAQLPLKMSIREEAGSGKPTVVAAPDSDEARIYRCLAHEVAAKVVLCGVQAGPSIEMADD